MFVNSIRHFFGKGGAGENTGSMFDSESALGVRIVLMGQGCLVLLCGVCFLLTLSMNGRKTFMSKPARFLMYGITAWLMWGMYITFSGLSFFNTGLAGYRTLVKLCAYTMTIFMGAKIVEVYDLKKEVAGIAAFFMGLTLLVAYITHFNGLEFLNSIANVLAKDDRYRVSFGLGHVNSTGRLCLDYFIFCAIYKTLLKERSKQNYQWGGGQDIKN